MKLVGYTGVSRPAGLMKLVGYTGVSRPAGDWSKGFQINAPFSKSFYIHISIFTYDKVEIGSVLFSNSDSSS